MTNSLLTVTSFLADLLNLNMSFPHLLTSTGPLPPHCTVCRVGLPPFSYRLPSLSLLPYHFLPTTS